MLDEVLEHHSNVFKPGVGLVRDTTATFMWALQLHPSSAILAQCHMISLSSKVEAELDRLEQEGIIKPVQFTEWAAPIVPVVKKDRSIHICGDYKVTINKAAKVDSYLYLVLKTCLPN